mmetsp:Transcript_138311/g.240449  ORF Transcript_138311/g.240449 Transcript_138311/m.240449 type:complete len:418 (-) Transcript_138311:431-1684(-)
MLAHYLSVVDAFFSVLPNMVFSPKEATRLVNTQLIPKLAFRMTAHCLDHNSMISIQNRIWAHYSRVTKLPKHTPPKARFAPSQEGALGLFHLPTRVAALTLTQYQRMLHGEGPDLACSLFLAALRKHRSRGSTDYSIATSHSKAAEAIGCQVKGLASQSRIHQHFLPQRQPHPRGFPPAHVLVHRVDAGVHSHHLSTQPVPPTQADLSKHGCHEAAMLLQQHPDADIGYTDGSNVHAKHSGAAAILVNSGGHGTFVHSMRVRETSPYPAELWALYLILIYAKRNTTLIALSDCSSALKKMTAIAEGGCEFYSHTHAHILRKIAKALADRQGPTYFAHIRSHVGFAGNEWADMFARRAAYVNPPPYPTSPCFTFTRGAYLSPGSHTITFSGTSSQNMPTPIYTTDHLTFRGTHLFFPG